MKGFSIDAPGTLLGQMQRGRGKAARQAIRHGRGRSALRSCLRHDPRLDVQVEWRAEYYAKLSLQLSLDPRWIGEPLAERGATEGCRKANLAALILMEMARRGQQDALTALEAGLDGHSWRSALTELAELELSGIPVSGVALAKAAIRLDAENLPSTGVQGFAGYGPTFCTWAKRSRRFAAAFESLRSDDPELFAPLPAPPKTKADTSLSTEALLAISEPRNTHKIIKILASRKDSETSRRLIIAANGDNDRHRLVAYSALGALADLSQLDAVCVWMQQDQRILAPCIPGPRSREQDRERAIRGRERSLRLRYLRALPCKVVLPLARRWMVEDGQSPAADDIMERCAQPADRAMLERELEAAADTLEIYHTCSMVNALEHAGDRRSIPLLEHTFEVAPYSATRWRVLKALADIDRRWSGPTSPLFEEALWDCEPEARRYAATHVPLGLAVQARLQDLALDPFEHEDVREIAGGRLRMLNFEDSDTQMKSPT